MFQRLTFQHTRTRTVKRKMDFSFVKSAGRILAVAAISLCAGNALAAESTASYEVGSKGNASSNAGTATVLEIT